MPLLPSETDECVALTRSLYTMAHFGFGAASPPTSPYAATIWTLWKIAATMPGYPEKKMLQKKISSVHIRDICIHTLANFDPEWDQILAYLFIIIESGQVNGLEDANGDHIGGTFGLYLYLKAGVWVNVVRSGWGEYVAQLISAPNNLYDILANAVNHLKELSQHVMINFPNPE
jgi:hypothetical protein